MSEVSLLLGSKRACVWPFSAASLLSRTWLARVGAGVLLGAEVDVLIRHSLFSKIHLPLPPSLSLFPASINNFLRFISNKDRPV